MNTEEIKKEYVLALRERFKHTTRPYEDIAGWAINDFIAEYIVKKLALYDVVVANRTLCEHNNCSWNKDANKLKCLECGEELNRA